MPYWNEPLRRPLVEPRYLTYGSDKAPTAWAALLAIGPPCARLGLLQRGPVSLVDEPLNHIAIRDLIHWAGSKGFFAVRISGVDAEEQSRITTSVECEHSEPFPYYKSADHDLVVSLESDCTEILSGFQKIARQEIRYAERAGFRIHMTDSSADFSRHWSLFSDLASRKGLSFRSVTSYLKLIDRCKKYGAVRIFIAETPSGTPVQMVLTIRDATTAHYVSGALDVDALGNLPSPATLVQWRAMCEWKSVGVTRYSLGTRSGPVYAFKRKFRPDELSYPSPATLVTGRARYGIWKFVLSQMKLRKSSLRRLLR
ncbi:MAG: GNAT family N-acetyltransferase [Armatimonadota bacterium]